MKRIMILLLLVLILAITSACGKEEEIKKEDAVKEEVATAEKEKGVEVEKGLLNVEVTLPKDFIDGDNIDDVIADAKQDGVKEVTQNEDGSLTYRMSKSVYRDLMKEMEENVVEYIKETKTSEDFASIRDIIHNKSFSEFKLVVDQETFENSFDGFAAIGLGMTGLLHQVFAGTSAEEAKVTISIEDADTGKVFDTIVYPDDLDDLEE
ncbi:hypothetical protein [Lederbergia lenta]|uniref:Antigen I/II N-terminal domain-containing protein n=1 Tax=Lederbergia lenta TaxID=1467 RepID=A0A2X4X0N5_LEDLE|nr:hypothetical protein [Lederbergia lenta]MCM3112892.1 hypothetical protein [Lederbergia lenta]MEC2326141.1 hypothetical protein [Lederbergia lenta]SQI63520.1 Uncharacterised protein [Lederbergia lenta]